MLEKTENPYVLEKQRKPSQSRELTQQQFQLQGQSLEVWDCILMPLWGQQRGCLQKGRRDVVAQPVVKHGALKNYLFHKRLK